MNALPQVNAVALPACEDWPASDPAAPWLVLLHGWGMDRSVWDACRSWGRHFRVRTIDLPGFGASAALGWPMVDTLLDGLAAALPAQSVLVGWSLGGQLATLLAARYPQRVTALVTIASNPYFLATPDWPGMDAGQARDFHRLVQQKGAAGLRRFAMLVAHGDRRERAVLESLRRPSIAPAGDSSLLASLDTLERLDTRAALQALPMPVTHVLGGCDALVPAALAASLRAACPQHRVQVLDGLSHAPFVSDPEAVLQVLLRAHAPHKPAVAQSFSRAAPSYDGAAALQRSIGERLLAHLPSLQAGQCVLDIGCGTGRLALQLRERFPQSMVLGLDLAAGMAATAQQRGVVVVQADAENLPLATASLDAVVSSAALQWCDGPRVLSEVWRVLKPGGRFVFSTFGTATLQELRTAFAAVDTHEHVNRFASLQDWQSWLSGWHPVLLQSASELRDYPALAQLLQELKQLGAHNLNGGRPRGLTGRRYWQRVQAAYPRQRDDGSCQASWEVITAVLEKPA